MRDFLSADSNLHVFHANDSGRKFVTYETAVVKKFVLNHIITAAVAVKLKPVKDVPTQKKNDTLRTG